MSKSKFADQLDEIRAALDDPALTPEGRVRAMLDQIERSTVPPDRDQAFRTELKQFAALIRDQRAKSADQSILVREAGDFYRRLSALARPALPTTPADEARRCFNHLQELGWASPTIELLESELKVGEKIVGCTGESVTTSAGRRIDRQQLIEKYRPHSMTPEHYPDWQRLHTRSEALQSRPD